MRVWRERAREEARLLNPSFLGLVMWSAGANFREAKGDGLPIQLAFLIAPITLHKATREALPRSPKTSLAVWLEENPFFRTGFAERAFALSPFVREALLFGAIHELFTIVGGRIVPARRSRWLSGYLTDSSDEVRNCVKKAGFVGMWFGSAGSPATVMALWGVKP